MEEVTGIRYIIIMLALFYSGCLFYSTKDTLLIFFTILLIPFCWWMPEKYLEIKTKRRMLNIQKSIPSIFTSTAILLDGGMNIQQVMETVSEITQNDLSKTIREAIHKTKMGVSLSKALEETLESCYLEEYRSFISTIIQGLEYGATGMTVLIRRLSYESWDARKRIAQDQAQKASTKLFLPMVFLVMPAFLIFLMGPMAFYIGRIFQ